METIQFHINQMGLILMAILLHFGGQNEIFGIQ